MASILLGFAGMSKLISVLVGLATIACGNSPDEPGEKGGNQTTEDGGVNGAGGGPGEGEPPGDGSVENGGEVNGDEAAEGSGSVACDQTAVVLRAVVRDFQGYNPKNKKGHPDFETFGGNAATKGLVMTDLGEDGKPVYTGLCGADFTAKKCPSGRQTTDEKHFNQWYRDTDGVNQAFEILFKLDPNPKGIRFRNDEFFPIDDVGFGNGDRKHNYHFTTEMRTEFVYKGGEKFTFEGDDDVWIFINNKLAADLGGLHAALAATVQLDDIAADLGLVVGNTYPFALFHAERHTEQSRFSMETNFQFTRCGESSGN